MSNGQGQPLCCAVTVRPIEIFFHPSHIDSGNVSERAAKNLKLPEQQHKIIQAKSNISYCLYLVNLPLCVLDACSNLFLFLLTQQFSAFGAFLMVVFIFFSFFMIVVLQTFLCIVKFKSDKTKLALSDCFLNFKLGTLRSGTQQQAKNH